MESDPRIAFKWANRIEEKTRKTKFGMQAYDHWRKEDAAAARAALEASDLSEELRRRDREARKKLREIPDDPFSDL
jgi:hypothetical protein